jgi:tetratricopeptide (TPR) repeat protein
MSSKSLRFLLGLSIVIGLAACQNNAKRYEEANQYFAAQAYELAIPIYESLLLKDSNNINLYPKLAISYAYAGDWDKCISYAKQAFEKKADLYQLYEITVKCHDAKGEVQEAKTLFEEGIAKYPDRQEFQMQYAQFRFQLKEFLPAAETFARLSDKDPKNTDYAYNAAASFESADVLDKAESFYRRVLSEDPRHANANFGLGSLYDKQKQAEKAIFFFEEALKENPQHLSALMNLARLQETKVPQEALKTWQKYLSLAEQNQQPEKFINQAKEHIKRLGGGAPVPDEKPPQDG